MGDLCWSSHRPCIHNTHSVAHDQLIRVMVWFVSYLVVLLASTAETIVDSHIGYPSRPHQELCPLTGWLSRNHELLLQRSQKAEQIKQENTG